MEERQTPLFAFFPLTAPGVYLQKYDEILIGLQVTAIHIWWYSQNIIPHFFARFWNLHLGRLMEKRQIKTFAVLPLIF